MFPHAPPTTISTEFDDVQAALCFGCDLQDASWFALVEEDNGRPFLRPAVFSRADANSLMLTVGELRYQLRLSAAAARITQPRFTALLSWGEIHGAELRQRLEGSLIVSAQLICLRLGDRTFLVDRPSWLQALNHILRRT